MGPLCKSKSIQRRELASRLPLNRSEIRDLTVRTPRGSYRRWHGSECRWTDEYHLVLLIVPSLPPCSWIHDVVPTLVAFLETTLVCPQYNQAEASLRWLFSLSRHAHALVPHIRVSSTSISPLGSLILSGVADGRHRSVTARGKQDDLLSA